MRQALPNQVHLDSKFVSLPPLPTIVKYFDNFEERQYDVRNLEQSDIWVISASGSKVSLSFSNYPPNLKSLLKCWVAYTLQTCASTTCVSYFSGLNVITLADVVLIVDSVPDKIQLNWNFIRGACRRTDHLVPLKTILQFLCRNSIGCWSPRYVGLLDALRILLPQQYPSVRNQEAFLTIREEQRVVNYIDDFVRSLKSRPENIGDRDLTDVALLISAYQFGMRPIQIGRLKMADFKIWKLIDGHISVHVTFKMGKQRSANKAHPMLRKIKDDWSIIFSSLHRRAKNRGLQASHRIFQINSATATSQRLSGVTGKFLDSHRTATEFRHTAAQRMADAGASREELADFLGHTDIQTANIYFESSPAQAALVNRALAISPTYTRVLDVARTRFISGSDLDALKNNQRIAAAPHGVVVKNIGGCSIGQDTCQLNPVLQCYGCQNFMPVNILKAHEAALDACRRIVSRFVTASKGETNAPAYLQLQSLLYSINDLIEQLKVL